MPGCEKQKSSHENTPDKEQMEIILKERNESTDTAFDTSLGGNNSKLTPAQKVGKGLTFVFVTVFIIAPIEIGLINTSIAATGGGPLGIAAEVVLIPAEIVLADFAISYGINTWEAIQSGSDVEFSWTILPALASELPNSIQEDLHELMPIVFP